MIPVILSGGSGSRLWPLSRKLYPKQFINLISDHTLFQETLLRLSGLPMGEPIVVCNEEHRFTAAENLQQIDMHAASIVLEPAGRNTAPAIAAAAHVAMKEDKDAVMLVLPADHKIGDVGGFKKVALEAEKLAKEGTIVTFGITPNCAHTGYGYIEKGKAIEGDAYKIAAFKEKPQQEEAEKLFKSGDYLWNSGMFCFKATFVIGSVTEVACESKSTIVLLSPSMALM